MESSSVLTLDKSIKLIVEVVSTNWRIDYAKKLADYEDLGIPEYWIIDCAALGGRRFYWQPQITHCHHLHSDRRRIRITALSGQGTDHFGHFSSIGTDGSTNPASRG
ncbi:MAG: Uma2 family endonuclease [Leptolyngbya sp. IPPAS B-1204]